jgi:NitT/TauT family transport system substrate-binding protein
LAALLTTLLVQACGGSTAAPQSSAPQSSAAPTPLTISYSEIYEGVLPIWVTYEAGIFDKHGLKVNMQYIASNTAIAALLSGGTQVSQGGGSEAVSATAGGADLVMIGTLVPVYPYVFEVNASIHTIADLRGRKVGVSSPGSQSDVATRIGLKREGLDPDKDVEIVAVGSSQNRTAALKSGAIQGGLDQMPFSLELEKAGLRRLFDMASLKLPTVNNGVVVQRSYLQAHRDVLQRYIDALVQGIARMKKDKPFTIGVLQKYLKVDDEQELSTTYDYATTNLFPSQPYVTTDQLNDTVQVLGKNNARVRSVDLNRMIDNSLVRSAVSRHLDK